VDTDDSPGPAPDEQWIRSLFARLDWGQVVPDVESAAADTSHHPVPSEKSPLLTAPDGGATRSDADPSGTPGRPDRSAEWCGADVSSPM
jgi:hypothetical protein